VDIINPTLFTSVKKQLIRIYATGLIYSMWNDYSCNIYMYYTWKLYKSCTCVLWM